MVLALGSYVGSFEHEVMTFMPYARWLSEILEYDSVYINVHHNRKWMYDFIKEENVIPIYEHLTRDEEAQQGYIHTEVKQKDFLILIKKFKNEIIERHNKNILKKDISLYNLPYMKSSPPIPFYNKIHEPLNIPEIEIDEDELDIVYIPCISEDEKNIKEVYNHLKSKYNCVVIGDVNTHLLNENKVLSYIDYSENVYKYILNYISKAKIVVCPISHWTFLCNLQGIPVISWGENIGQYRKGGIYNFNNKECMTTISTENLPEMIDYFINKSRK